MIADTVFTPLGYSHNVLWLVTSPPFVLSCAVVKKVTK